MARGATAEANTKALAKREGDTVATNPMTILQCVVDQKATPAEIREVMEIANHWQDREAARVFGERFAAFQAEVPQVEKRRAVNTKGGDRMYQFAAMEDVDRVVQPVKARFGLSTSGTIKSAPDGVHVEWTLQIGSHREKREYVLPTIAPAGLVQNANATQNLGAWLSYIRRYTYCLALGVVVRDEDTDANDMAALLVIDARQREELTALIAQERMDDAKIAKLLRWVGAESVETITRAQWKKIITTYRRKKEEAKAAEAGTPAAV
jgi:hypothetical protein